MFLAVADVRDHIDVLVYLLRWDDVEWAASVPAQQSGERPRPVTVVGQCMVVVNAITGVPIRTTYTAMERSIAEP
jgi:hypothetical protein